MERNTRCAEGRGTVRAGGSSETQSLIRAREQRDRCLFSPQAQAINSLRAKEHHLRTSTAIIPVLKTMEGSLKASGLLGRRLGFCFMLI